MSDDLIREVRKLETRRGDTVVVTIPDDADDEVLHLLQPLLYDFAHDTGTFVLVFREGVFSDIRRLNLTELLDLNQRVEERITEITTAESVGSC